MSDIHDLTIHAGKRAEELGHSDDPKVILLFLLEELGEVARAFLKEEGHKEDNNRIVETYKQELGDVFFLLLRLAHIKGIDLERQLEYTLEKLGSRSFEES
ncbi:MAG: MazG nucleotide pyrophosphohydrolase domain-containing protein [bacterium]|nr:MazG nucleotide pyrophosphohydrolase domain-containing protein [bacterium]